MSRSLLILAALAAAAARAEEDDAFDPADAMSEAAAPEEAADAYEAAPAQEGGAISALGVKISAYVDAGYFNVQGDGSGVPPNETRFPVDYAADTFAPMINSRGEVASLGAGIARDGVARGDNAFVPATVGGGGAPTFLVNEVNLDLVSQPHAQVLLFVSADLAPRLGERKRNSATLDVDQAFLRLTPVSTLEWTVTAGRFDSVFGIEYLDNESPLRVGITPSLMSRYTAGHPLGVKSFFRQQIQAIEGAVSLNVMATNGGPTRDDWSSQLLDLRGRPFLAGRLGFELNLPSFQLKLGASGGQGPRDDQPDPAVAMWLLAGDLRFTAGPVSLAAEVTKSRRDEGGGNKFSGPGLVSALEIFGGWATLSAKLPADWAGLAGIAPYVRAERRWGNFPGFAAVQVDRLTAGLRVDLTERIALKAEGAWNREPEGFDNANVDDDVFTTSLVGSL